VRGYCFGVFHSLVAPRHPHRPRHPRPWTV